MNRSRFPALLATAFVAASALGLTGCLQTDDRTTLLADGSGTMSQTMTMDVSKMKELEELSKMAAGALAGAPGTPGAPAGGADGGLGLGRVADEVMSEKGLREALESTPGVQVKRLSSETKEGKRVLDVEFAFSDFSALGKGGFQTTNVELKKNDDATWTLTFDGLKDVLGSMGGLGAAGAHGVPGMPTGMDPSMVLGLVEPYFGSLSLHRRITLPGKVVATNGKTSEDGASVDWTVTFKDITASMAAKDGKPAGFMTVTFKGDGLSLKPFTYRPDTAAKIRKLTEPSRPVTPPAPPAAPSPAVTPSEK